MENQEQKNFNLGFNVLPSNQSVSRSLLINPAPAGWGYVGTRMYIVPHDLRSADNSFLVVAIGEGEFQVEWSSIEPSLIRPSGLPEYNPELLAVTAYHARVNEVVFQGVPAQLHHLFLGSVGFLFAVDGNADFSVQLGFIVLEGHYKRLTRAELVRQAQKRKSDPSPDVSTHENLWQV